MLSSLNFFRHAQVYNGTFQGFFTENVGFFHIFSVMCLFFQDFLQKNVDKNLSRYFSLQI